MRMTNIIEQKPYAIIKQCIPNFYIKRLVEGTQNYSQHENNSQPKEKKSPIDCDGMQLTNAQHGTYIHIMLQIIYEVYNWNIHLKPNRKERIPGS